jgi:hypothetical protein
MAPLTAQIRRISPGFEPSVAPENRGVGGSTPPLTTSEFGLLDPSRGMQNLQPRTLDGVAEVQGGRAECQVAGLEHPMAPLEARLLRFCHSRKVGPSWDRRPNPSN